VACQATLGIARLSAVTSLDLLRVAGLAPRGSGVLETDMREVVASAAFDVGVVDVGHMALPRAEFRP
jgi:hypothetical protein